MVRGFAYTISQTAIENTPIGDAEQYIKLYELRQGRTGLEPVEGFARGSWQVNTTGQFSMQAIYGDEITYLGDVYRINSFQSFTAHGKTILYKLIGVKG